MARMTDVAVKAKGLLSAVHKLVPSRNLALLVLQLLGFLAVLVGISWWSVPAALVVGGIAIIAAVEMQARETPEAEAPETEIRVDIHRLLKEGKNPFENGIPMTEKWLRYVDLVTRPKATG